MSSRLGRWAESLRAGVGLLALFTLLPAALWAIGYDLDQTEQAAAAARDRARLLAAGAAQGLEAELDATRRLLVLLAGRPGVRSADADAEECAALQDELSRFGGRAAGALQLWHADGSALCPPAAGGAPAAAPPWLARALAGRGLYVGTAADGPQPGRPHAVLAWPVADDRGRPAALLVWTRTPDGLLQPLRARLPAGAVATLLVDGRRPPAPADGGATQAEVPVAGSPWTLAVALPPDAVAGPRNLTRLTVLVLIIGSGLLAFSGAAWLMRRLMGPLQTLAQTARDVSTGDAAARAPLQGPAELRALAQAFNDMLDVKQAVEGALADSESRWRTLNSLTADWFWEQDEQFRFVSISEGIREHTAFTREDHLGRTRWELPWVDMDPARWDEHRELLRRHEPFHDFEVVRPGPDGARHHVLVSGVPLFDTHGRFVGYRGLGRDVTQQRLDRQALQRSEQQYRRLVEHLPVGVVAWPVSAGEPCLHNAEACRLTGLSGEQLARRLSPPDWRMVDAAGVPLAPQQGPVGRVFADRVPVLGQVFGIDTRPGAERTWVLANAFPEFDDHGELRAVVATLMDITASRQAQALQREREQAEIANRAKSDFVSRMSHELRTPLNAVLGFSEVLRADPALRGQARAQRQLGHIHQAGSHLLELVDDLLDIAGIENGVLRIASEPVALAPLLDECLALHAPAAAAAGVALLQQPPTPGLHVRGDVGRLRQVLNNLIGNAIKYNRRGGSVHLGVRSDGLQVHIDVADTGRGLGPVERAALFQPFNRLGAERLGIPGTGLGLVISRQLAVAMGGEIDARGERGVGSTFTLRLARADAGHAAAPADVASAPPGAVAPRRVLCVEDDPASRELLASAFAHWPGTTIDLAAAGEQGLALARSRQPDLAVVDIGLPDIDGLEVLRRLRADAATARLPCIAVSAGAGEEDRARALAAGFDDFLGKPLRVAELLARAGALLA